MEREHEVDEADKGEKQKSEGGENSTPAEKKPVATKSLKVEVRLQAAGDAPIMKQKNYKVDGEKKISWIIQFIRKYLKLEPADSLFLYVNQAFSPSPDQTVSNLNECFGSTDNKLVLYYSRSECWG